MQCFKTFFAASEP